MMTNLKWIERQKWEEIANRYHELGISLSRIPGGLFITLPMSVGDRWMKLGWKVQVARTTLTNRAFDQHESELSEFLRSRDREFHRYDWPKPRGTRKRPLSREEWTAIGYDVKNSRHQVMQIGIALQPYCSRPARIAVRPG